MKFEIEIRKAFELHQAGKLDAALNAYKNLNRKYPSDGNVLQLIGSLYLQKNEFNKSLEFLIKAENKLNNFAPLKNNIAICYKKINDLLNAEKYAKKAIQLDKNYMDAVSLLVGIYIERKLFNNVIDLLKNYNIETNSKLLNDRGICYAENLDYKKAAEDFKLACLINNKYDEAYNNLANIYIKKNELEEALSIINNAINLNENKIEYKKTKIIILHALSRFDAAAELLEKIDQDDQDKFTVYFLKGIQAAIKKNYKEAIFFYSECLVYNKDNVDLYNNLGLAYFEDGKTDEAIVNYEIGIKINPKNSNLHYNLANAFVKLKKYKEAEYCYDKSIDLEPSKKEYYNNYSVLKYSQRDYKCAIDLASKCIEIDNKYPNPYINKAMALERISDYKSANENYIIANELTLEKENKHSCINQIMLTSRYMCDWSEFEKNKKIIEDDLKCEDTVSVPFNILATFDSPKLQKMGVQSWAKRINKIQELENISFGQKSGSNNKIKIAYISCDFNNHPVSFLIAELLETHSRTKFEIYALSYGPQTNDKYYQRISNAVDKFVDVESISDKQVAELSRTIGIDIAIDLSGYTHGCRTEIFKYRAAPIQISYLGYMGSMDIDCIDFIIADKFLISEEQKKYTREKIIYLPVYQANDTNRNITDIYSGRDAFNLPENCFVYCCFNNAYKITPEIFNAWMRILKGVKNSVLFLYEENKWQKINLLKFAEDAGVDPSRLIFSEKIPLDNYLERFKFANLFLDTFPYNAGTTANDALYAGLPVLTYSGESIVSRMAGSLLTSLSLDELITVNIEDYTNKAIELGNDSCYYDYIKSKLDENKKHSILFNSEEFKNSIEEAYISLLNNKYNGINQDLLIDNKLNLSGINGFKPLIKNFLHVGCGPQNKSNTTIEFSKDHWVETRFDIDLKVNPDIVGTMTDMKNVPTDKFDAIFSSHNIEHLYSNEIPLALQEFYRVLNEDGFVVLTCPDLQSVASLVADDKLLDTAYVSAAGPITPFDILFGFRAALQRGNIYMAHRSGFTQRVLQGIFRDEGFESTITFRRPSAFDIWLIATKSKKTEDELKGLAELHFPK